MEQISTLTIKLEAKCEEVNAAKETIRHLRKTNSKKGRPRVSNAQNEKEFGKSSNLNRKHEMLLKAAQLQCKEVGAPYVKQFMKGLEACENDGIPDISSEAFERLAKTERWQGVPKEKDPSSALPSEEGGNEEERTDVDGTEDEESQAANYSNLDDNRSHAPSPFMPAEPVGSFANFATEEWDNTKMKNNKEKELERDYSGASKEMNLTGMDEYEEDIIMGISSEDFGEFEDDENVLQGNGDDETPMGDALRQMEDRDVEMFDN